MQQTIETSTLIKHRLSSVVEKRSDEMEKAILAKDFQTFAEITMKDSNQFHAVCLDTYPPIFYLTDTSRLIIQTITRYNAAHGKAMAAYTFDAGPNAVIYAPKENMDELIKLLLYQFPPAEDTKLSDYYRDEKTIERLALSKDSIEAFKAPEYLSSFPRARGELRYVLHTTLGDGPKVLGEADSLLGSDGLPKSK